MLRDQCHHLSTMKREVQSLKSELRALRTGHLTCPPLKSDFPGHLKRNFDTRPTVTLSMTTVVKSA